MILFKTIHIPARLDYDQQHHTNKNGKRDDNDELELSVYYENYDNIDFLFIQVLDFFFNILKRFSK